MRTIEKLQRAARQNAVDHGFADAEFGERIALIHSELSEALEAYRDPGHSIHDLWFDEEKPEGVPAELADAVIRILDTCEAYGIDLSRALEVKMAYNATRPFRHGGKRL